MDEYPRGLNQMESRMLRNGHVRFGGPGKPTSRKADRAPRSDPYTYVATWSGTVYVVFVFDVFSRRIVGWRAVTTMTTELVLDTLEHAIWSRRQQCIDDLTGLIHHTDAGSQLRFKGSSQHRLVQRSLGAQ